MTQPCAACKHLHQACNSNCDLAPYFPADKPHRFKAVHTVFGKRNVSKLLQELDISQREEAVNSLVYEAEARMRDPVYGYVGLVSFLQQRLKELQEELRSTKNELAKYVDRGTTEFIINNPDLFGFEPDNNQNPQSLLSNNIGESQQRPIVMTAAEQQRNLEQLRQMFGLSYGTFETGGTSTGGGYQIQQPPHQQE